MCFSEYSCVDKSTTGLHRECRRQRPQRSLKVDATLGAGRRSSLSRRPRRRRHDHPHAHSLLTGVSLIVPFANGHLLLGAWQGIYLFEHRIQEHRREIVVMLTG
ncbi:MAG: YjbQ family protein [Azonexus sp.]|nr:YjbQ family protein [Azonexus sp.]